MTISGVSYGQGLHASAQATARPTAADSANGGTAATGFAERLSGALQEVAEQQASANEAARDFELGRTDDLASVMVEQQVSSLGFQMTLQVRNKALTAYRDIMNMPV